MKVKVLLVFENSFHPQKYMRNIIVYTNMYVMKAHSQKLIKKDLFGKINY